MHKILGVLHDCCADINISMDIDEYSSYLKKEINISDISTKGRGVGHVDISLHLPHVIINSMQAPRALSHLQITLRKAQFISIMTTCIV